ncbi:hypothetical protein EV421DRAFT_1900920 [Armillaria borealis]|uniref:Heterokaryon incompatibility domain-containing protein n=1 Tax=Armillaria borealis TaxID=47425 RepID=A0AA39JTD9_9AGAR|nr:hypothetical protein EV421DRAFT_1900920 [Armillaria borealis]
MHYLSVWASIIRQARQIFNSLSTRLHHLLLTIQHDYDLSCGAELPPTNWQPSTQTMDTGESYFRRQEEEGEYRFNLSRGMGTQAMNFLDKYHPSVVNHDSPDRIPWIKIARENPPQINHYSPIQTPWDKIAREDPPQITLSTFAETGRAESTVPVLMQRSYTGKRVVSSALADTLARIDFGIKLGGTLYTIDSAVISVLNSYIVQNLDFGIAYAFLRPYWNQIDTIEYKLRAQEKKDREMRRSVLVDGRITTRHVPARRVWDLYANRVIPYWVACEHPWGISHAWVDEKDRVNVMTPINGYEWPVPIPKDTNLDLIRIEMLNLGVKYAWLDVLCLRQEGGKGEHLRLEEWKLDVPTIGSVFEMAGNVSDRCWFRRAWTLQEITQNPIIGGKTGDDIMEEGVRRRFDEQLTSLREMRQRNMALTLVSEMQHRVSTKPLDKVAGLAYLLQTDSIPIYDAEQSAADAWEVLMDAMGPRFRTPLLFYYHEPGDGRKRWRPSWEQVMTNKIMVPSLTFFLGWVNRTDDPDADCYTGYHIESANVQGLSEVQTEPTPRQGELVLKDATEAPRTLKIVA